MIANMLHKMGFFIGWSLEPNFEARFFLTINQLILNAYGARWDNPEPAENLLKHSDLRTIVRQNILNDLYSFRAFYFLGPKRYIRYRSIPNLNVPWGWKDPRTTLLLPLWLEIFPAAKILHIYRNGIDVANSLMKREHRRLKNITNSTRFLETVSSQKKQIIKDGLILYFMNKIQSRYNKLSPFYRYKEIGISQCISVEKGFELWCEYMNKSLEYTEVHHNKFLNIRYEDFLVEPRSNLLEILSFCGISLNEKKLDAVVADVNPERGYAFRKDKSLLEYYGTVKKHPLMIKLGYGDEKNVD